MMATAKSFCCRRWCVVFDEYARTCSASTYDSTRAVQTSKPEEGLVAPPSRLSMATTARTETVPRPKPRELHRMLAAALQMSGEDIDEHLLTRRDTDEVRAYMPQPTQQRHAKPRCTITSPVCRSSRASN